MNRDLNLELKLLLGKPILIDKLGFLYPLTINEIVEIGVNNYYSLISLLLCDVEELKKNTNNLYSSNIDYLANICLQTIDNKIIDNKKYILDFLTKLFKEKVSLHKIGFFYLGELSENRIIDELNYQKIKEIIKHQNCIKKEEQKSEKLKKFEKKLEEMRKKYGKDNTTTLVEVVSAVSSKHPSINLLNIGDSTIYQVYDYLTRLNMIESYSFNIMAMIQGASKDNDLESKHWSLRINK